MEEIIASLKSAFFGWAGEPCLQVEQLPASGSERTYWRLTGSSVTAIGAFHPVREENAAFLALTAHFKKHGLNVPDIYFSDLAKGNYLMQDLGDVTLFSLLDQKAEGPFTEEVIACFAKALEELARFQVTAGQDLDYSQCYPRKSFDRQSLEWDLDYFKYNFLKLAAGFNEQKLEEDFKVFIDFLLKAPQDYFMYRDFQSRNIMIHHGSLFFIDYQGGRKGPLQYDPVSLLYQVRTEMPGDIREKLLQHYLDSLEKLTDIRREEFLAYYEGFILLRLLQVLAAYGFRGLIQKKSHFLASIPYAIRHLNRFLESNNLPVNMPELMGALQKLTSIGRFKAIENDRSAGLTVEVQSFAYKNGYPEDLSGHGGGFVFDCRALPNPGREESMRTFNGKDEIIVTYLEEHTEVAEFLENAFDMVSQAVDSYLSRGFDRLSVSFGCTGGQHRSVYCAEHLAALLQAKYTAIRVRLSHRERSAW